MGMNRLPQFLSWLVVVFLPTHIDAQQRLLNRLDNFTDGCQVGDELFFPPGYGPDSKVRVRKFSEAVAICKEAGGYVVDSYNDKCLKNLIGEIRGVYTYNGIQQYSDFALTPSKGPYIHYPNRPKRDYYRWFDFNGNTKGSRSVQGGTKSGRVICMRWTVHAQLGCPKNKYIVFPNGITYDSYHSANNDICVNQGLTVPDDTTFPCVQIFIQRLRVTRPSYAQIPFAGPIVHISSGVRILGSDLNTRDVNSFEPHIRTRFRVLCIGTDVDECSMRTHECGSNKVCENNVGSYTCKCADGYKRGAVKQDAKTLGSNCLPTCQIVECPQGESCHSYSNTYGVFEGTFCYRYGKK